MTEILVVISFLFGILVGIFSYNLSALRQNLSIAVLILPYIILNFMSAPTMYPQLEDARVIYFWGAIGIFISWIVKEQMKKSKKTSS